MLKNTIFLVKNFRIKNLFISYVRKVYDTKFVTFLALATINYCPLCNLKLISKHILTEKQEKENWRGNPPAEFYGVIKNAQAQDSVV